MLVSLVIIEYTNYLKMKCEIECLIPLTSIVTRTEACAEPAFRRSRSMVFQVIVPRFISFIHAAEGFAGAGQDVPVLELGSIVLGQDFAEGSAGVAGLQRPAALGVRAVVFGGAQALFIVGVPVEAGFCGYEVSQVA